jgi:pimeloyl-ACP methyl ester carboxylesterase
MGARSIETIASADGTVIGFERVGSGPNVLAVHGGTADRTRWQPVVDPLASQLTLHLMDRRGRGLSKEEAQGAYSIDREAEDIAAVLAAIGGPTLVLGHSYGGACSLEALPLTDLVAGALLYEPAIATPGLELLPPATLDAMRSVAATGDAEGILRLFFSQVLQLDDSTIDAMHGTPIWNARLDAAPTLIREAEWVAGGSFVSTKFADVAIPTRILVGTDTTPGLAAAAQEAHRALPTSDVVMLEGQGHMAIDTDTEGFVAEVLAFAAKTF